MPSLLLPGVEPYYHDPKHGIVLYCGDARELLPLIPAGAVDLVLTDPPYNIGTPQRVADLASADRRLVGGDFGTFDEGAIEPAEWFPLMPQLVVSFYGAKGMHRLICAGESSGFEIVQDFHWCKLNPPVPMRSVGFAWAVESGYVFRRVGFKHRPNNDAGICGNWKSTPICNGPERTDHPTQKPLSVMRWLVSHWSFPGNAICDPFCGSGTTLVAAKLEGRSAIGFECNPDYCAIAASRLRQGVIQFPE